MITESLFSKLYFQRAMDPHFAHLLLAKTSCGFFQIAMGLLVGASIAGGIIGGLAVGGALLRMWMQGAKCRSTARLDGKTVVITGANTGIGKETALDLSRRGAKIVMLCRNVEKGEKAADEIRKRSEGEVVVQKMDLASLKNVKECCDQLGSSLNKIDILINNAHSM